MSYRGHFLWGCLTLIVPGVGPLPVELPTPIVPGVTLQGMAESWASLGSGVKAQWPSPESL